MPLSQTQEPSTALPIHDPCHPRYFQPLGPQHEQTDVSPFDFLEATSPLAPCPLRRQTSEASPGLLPHDAEQHRVTSELPTADTSASVQYRLLLLRPQAQEHLRALALLFPPSRTPLLANSPAGLFQALYPSCCEARSSHTLTPERAGPGSGSCLPMGRGTTHYRQ